MQHTARYVNWEAVFGGGSLIMFHWDNSHVHSEIPSNKQLRSRNSFTEIGMMIVLYFVDSLPNTVVHVYMQRNANLVSKDVCIGGPQFIFS